MSVVVAEIQPGHRDTFGLSTPGGTHRPAEWLAARTSWNASKTFLYPMPRDRCKLATLQCSHGKQASGATWLQLLCFFPLCTPSSPSAALRICAVIIVTNKHGPEGPEIGKSSPDFILSALVSSSSSSSFVPPFSLSPLPSSFLLIKGACRALF